jgi:hypothetical protein
VWALEAAFSKLAGTILGTGWDQPLWQLIASTIVQSLRMTSLTPVQIAATGFHSLIELLVRHAPSQEARMARALEFVVISSWR